MKRMLGIGIAATIALGAGAATAHNVVFETDVSVFEGASRVVFRFLMWVTPAGTDLWVAASTTCRLET